MRQHYHAKTNDFEKSFRSGLYVNYVDSTSLQDGTLQNFSTACP